MTIILNGTTGITTPGITNQGVVEFTAGSVSAPSITTTGDTNTGIYFPAADTIAFTEGGVESLRITSAGDVGIGTASPGQKLEVAGNISALGVSGSTRYIGTLNETSAYTGALTLQAGGGSTGFGGGVVMYGHSHATYPGGVWIGRSSGSSGPIMFGDGGIGPGTEQMRLTSGGNLGIGTTSPGYKLDVNATGGSAATARLIGNDQSNVRLRLENIGSGGRTWEIVGGSPGVNNSNFSIRDVTGSTTPLTIDSSGNVTVVGGSLQVNAAGTVANFTSGGLASSATVQIQAANGAGYDARLYFECPGSNSGGFTYERSTNRLHAYNQTNLSGPYVSANGTSWTTGSDQRLKKNIQSIEYGLNAVMALLPKRYVYKNNEEKQCFGLIAQDVFSVIPEIVDIPKDADEMMGIEYQSVIPVLVKAIQELSAKVTALESK